MLPGQPKRLKRPSSASPQSCPLPANLWDLCDQQHHHSWLEHLQLNMRDLPAHELANQHLKSTSSFLKHCTVSCGQHWYWRLATSSLDRILSLSPSPPSSATWLSARQRWLRGHIVSNNYEHLTKVVITKAEQPPQNNFSKARLDCLDTVINYYDIMSCTLYLPHSIDSIAFVILQHWLKPWNLSQVIESGWPNWIRMTESARINVRRRRFFSAPPTVSACQPPHPVWPWLLVDMSSHVIIKRCDKESWRICGEMVGLQTGMYVYNTLRVLEQPSNCDWVL